jgi:hypothetical protein
VPVTSAATLSGTVTSQNAALAGTVADVELSVLETVNTATYTIPLAPTATQHAPTLSVETAASTATNVCSPGTDCASYALQLASGGPYVGAWTSGGATLTQSAPWATYMVDGAAFVQSSGGTADCNPSELKSTANAFTAGGPFSVSVQTLAFVQCQ